MYIKRAESTVRGSRITVLDGTVLHLVLHLFSRGLVVRRQSRNLYAEPFRPIGVRIHQCTYEIISVLVLLVVFFFLTCENLKECSTIHSPPALFVFVFLMETSSRTLIPLFRPGSVHSASAS